MSPSPEDSQAMQNSAHQVTAVTTGTPESHTGFDLLGSPNHAAAALTLKQAQAHRAKEKGKDLGAHEWTALRKLLIAKYGSITGAWRNHLDKGNLGKLPFQTFVSKARDLSFSGNAKASFAEIDSDGSGVITFDEVDREWCSRLSDFHTRLLAKFEDYQSAWRNVDVNGNNMLEDFEFASMCEDVGYQGDPKKLFKQHLRVPGARYCTVEDLRDVGKILQVSLASKKQVVQRSQTRLRSQSDGSTLSTKGKGQRSKKVILEERVDGFVQRQAEPSPQNRIRLEASALQRELLHHSRSEADVLLSGAQGPQGFRQVLANKFGSVATAWRTGLDSDGNGKISLGEFLMCCQKMNFTGNFKKLWKELDTDTDGFISLHDLDPVAATELDDFRTFCLNKYGSTLHAWQQGINPDGLLGVPEKLFASRCKDMGFEGDGRKLFKLLRTDHFRKDLRIEDFDPQTAAALLRADSCAESISCGGGRKAFAPPMPKAPLTPLIKARSGSASNILSGNKRPTSKNQQLSAQSLKLLPKDNKIDDPLSDYWNVCSAPATPSKRSPMARRRMAPPAIDSDNESSLLQEPMMSPGRSPSESTMARSRSYSSPEERWSVLATPTRNSGFIRDCSSIQVLDMRLRKENHECADLSAKSKEEVMQQLIRVFGSMRRAWYEVLDPHDTGRIGFQEFCDRLRSVGYHGNMKDTWNALAGEKEDVLRLRNFDPENEQLLESFRSTLSEKHGNMLNAWQKAYDPQGLTMIDEATFVKQCELDGVEGDAAKIFRMLQEDPSRKLITLREFDFPAYQALARYDLDMMIKEEQDAKKPSPMSLSFDERQDRTFSLRWSRAQSIVAKQVLQGRADQEHAGDCGCDTLESMKAMLIKKYGNLATAWRVALDPLGQGHLAFEDFCSSVRNRVGYNGDLRALWLEIAKPGAGQLSLHDLDPASADVLWNFRALLLEKFGDLMKAWHEGLDPKRRGKLEEHDFYSRVKELGYQGDERRLFQLLLAEPHKKYIVLRDLDPAAAQAFFRGDNRSLTLYGTQSGPQASPRHWTGKIGSRSNSKAQEDDQEAGEASPMSSPSSPSSPSRPRSSSAAQLQAQSLHRPTRLAIWSEELGIRKRQEAEKRFSGEVNMQLGAKTLSDYRRLLVKRFGSLVAAWCYGLDPDNTGRLSHVQFIMAVGRVGGYVGGLKQLWAEFDSQAEGAKFGSAEAQVKEKERSVTLQDWDKEAYDIMEAFCKAVLKQYNGPFDSLQGFWRSLDLRNEEKIDEETFVVRCHELLPENAFMNELQRLFKWLLPAHYEGRRMLIEDDLQALLLALPSRERGRAWSGQAPPQSAQAGDQVNSPGGATANVPATPPQESSPRSRPRTSPYMPVPTIEDFRKTLKRLYGSVYSGWVKYLDVTEVGRVPMGEFVNRARGVGVGQGAVLFALLDADKKGFITFQDLDLEASKAVKAFMLCVEGKFGSMSAAWTNSFNVSKRRVIGLEEFTKGCQAIEYQGDPAKLFAMMKPDPGRPFLELADFGRNPVRSVRAHEDG
eukprot:TRINITY_DN90598_c0_g1_i1.p1 TRINITY_DN90598_c0_g1~~TRINITY_DN90598_c0_g1_i1.p1  ORF type:complete len:1547 (+),score=371.71 TRINITY_DN90598_c0_g1_i1:74-4642(+)